MRIGLLITSIGNFGKKGYYNAQEIGLAKELDKLFDEVVVYKAVPLSAHKSSSIIEGCEHASLLQIPVKSHGINGEWNCNVMDPALDALIYFSDTQLAVPKVYKWCQKNNVVILSRLVDTFISRISLTMLPVPNPHNTVCVLSWEEARHWQSRSSGYSSS